MIFTKPTRDLSFEDIQALVDSEELEAISLEYKQEVDTSPGGKKELAKDVSAMANSQGGHLIIGIAEDDHRPVMPEQFVPRMLKQQKVEEWVEQVLDSNIAERVDVRIKPIPVPDGSEQCIVVIHVPRSPRVPHMVTAQGDNRYYKRHNFQTLPAEEYEVRDLFERGRRMREEVEKYLTKRRFLDPEDPLFGVNDETRRLGLSYFDTNREHILEETAHSVISFVACPSVLEEWIDTASEDLRSWVNSDRRVYRPGGPFVPRDNWHDILDGLIYLENIWPSAPDRARRIKRYLAVHRNGYVEYGYGDGKLLQGMRVINFVWLAGRFWQFLGFAHDLYNYLKLPVNAIIALNVVNAEGTVLAGWGGGWKIDRETVLEEAAHVPRHVRHLQETNVQSLQEDSIEDIVRQFAARIGNAFGQSKPRCFNSGDDSFPMARFRPRQ